MWGERAMENSGTVSSYSAHKNNYSNGYQSTVRRETLEGEKFGESSKIPLLAK